MARQGEENVDESGRVYITESDRVCERDVQRESVELDKAFRPVRRHLSDYS